MILCQGMRYLQGNLPQLLTVLAEDLCQIFFKKEEKEDKGKFLRIA